MSPPSKSTAAAATAAAAAAAAAAATAATGSGLGPGAHRIAGGIPSHAAEASGSSTAAAVEAAAAAAARPSSSSLAMEASDGEGETMEADVEAAEPVAAAVVATLVCDEVVHADAVLSVGPGRAAVRVEVDDGDISEITTPPPGPGGAASTTDTAAPVVGNHGAGRTSAPRRVSLNISGGSSGGGSLLGPFGGVGRRRRKQGPTSVSCRADLLLGVSVMVLVAVAVGLAVGLTTGRSSSAAGGGDAAGSSTADGNSAAKGQGSKYDGKLELGKGGGKHWKPIGRPFYPNLDVPAEFGSFGGQITSSDGTVMATGFPSAGDANLDVGAIVVHRLDLVGLGDGDDNKDEGEAEARWTQMGSLIMGAAEGDMVGDKNSLALSADGTVLVSASRLGEGTRGAVRVYRYAEGEDEEGSGGWTLLGTPIVGNHPGDRFGTSVALSPDGAAVAIGAPGDAAGGGQGRVRVLRFNEVEQEWDRVGEEDIVGTGGRHLPFGWISLVNGGTIVALAETEEETIDGSGPSGWVRVLRFNGKDWNQVGETVGTVGGIGEEGTATSDGADFGAPIQLSENKNILVMAVSSRDKSGPAANRAGVYYFSETDGKKGWQLKGRMIDGYKMAFYSDLGKVAVLRETPDETNESTKLSVSVFTVKDLDWVQRGAEIDGYSTHMSRDGRILHVTGCNQFRSDGVPLCSAADLGTTVYHFAKK
mmetsp:Transcript_25486/g.73711  ORF Transcript_25486/g.73711 Transcript_25486/m.73711 type:complete len:703 (+) Transcript_25486:163-2271(+)